MKKTGNTRYANTPEAIAADFAEHLKYTIDSDVFHRNQGSNYEALALAVRDRIIHHWDITRKVQRSKHVKRAYYLSLEFLMGRALSNNIINLGIENEVTAALKKLGYKLEDLADMEPDAGLGNGGLGRLAACFLDSMATMEIPSYGYGIRYNYGIFTQKIVNGYQVEQPDSWLKNGNPWEFPRETIIYSVGFGGEVKVIKEGNRDIYKWIPAETVNGQAYDTPVVGFGGNTINTLRLWSAKPTKDFLFAEFNDGDYTEAVREKIKAENISQVLYPNDTQYMGKVLRLKQQYFFVCCSLLDIIKRFKRENEDWNELPNFAAIQLNDTHPSIAIAEMMRILVDLENLDWDSAWKITRATFGYTNHTLMPEALEKWSVPMMQEILPRHMQIIFEINYRFIQNAIPFFPLQNEKIAKLSIIEESQPKNVRMANLAIIGSHSTNGVAELHSRLLKESMFPEFNAIFPDRFNNKTNGITQRRWLLAANPGLSSLITEAIGDGWIKDFSQISKLKPFAEDSAFAEKFAKIKQNNKKKLATFLKNDCGIILNPNSIIDVQVKRIHEYKRQLMNALNIILIYTKLKTDKSFYKSFPRTTFLIGGKAAPGYVNAKLSIKFINSIAKVINADAETNKKLQAFFVPNYRVTLAENIIPAANISQQISTAGLEASGTGNMKFMCNGALTLGTLDGANVEIAKEVGNDNIFIFGHTEDQIEKLKGHYNPYNFIMQDEEIKHVVDIILSNYFNVNEPGIFENLRRAILDNGDKFFIFADLKMYAERHQEMRTLYRNNFEDYNRKAILNVAASGKFSSDRTIGEYAKEIWNTPSCHIPSSLPGMSALEEAKKN